MESRPGRAPVDKLRTPVMERGALADVSNRKNQPSCSWQGKPPHAGWRALTCGDECANESSQPAVPVNWPELTNDATQKERGNLRIERQSNDDEDDDDELIALAKKRKEERFALRDLRKMRDELAVKIEANEEIRRVEAIEHVRQREAAVAECGRLRAKNELLLKAAEKAKHEAAAKQAELSTRIDGLHAENNERQERLRLVELEVDKLRATEKELVAKVEQLQHAGQEALAEAERLQSEVQEAACGLAELRSEQRRDAAQRAEQRARYQRVQANALYANSLCMAAVEAITCRKSNLSKAPCTRYLCVAQLCALSSCVDVPAR